MKERSFDRASGAAGALSAIGAAGAATASSACCWLPLTMLAFGASAAGASAFFERWRPYFAVAAIALLGFGFYSAYFRAGACCKDGHCDARARRRLRMTRGALWVSAVVVAAFVSFPKYAGNVIETMSNNAGAGNAVTDAATSPALRFDVQGMTCEACAVTLRADLSRINGVESAEVDYATKSAIVRSLDPAVIDKVREAAARHGYTATPTTDQDPLVSNEGDTP